MYVFTVYRAVLAHPPKTINGKFRVTEQGEMITQNFGSIGVAERTLDIYTAAVLAEKFSTHVDPRAEWRAQMDRLSEISCEAYRKVIQVLVSQINICLWWYLRHFHSCSFYERADVKCVSNVYARAYRRSDSFAISALPPRSLSWAA